MERRGALALVGWVVVGLACVGGDPPKQSCVQLGAHCGVDDYGRSCGTCTGGNVCDFGICRSPGGACSCGGNECGEDTCGQPTCGTCASREYCAFGTCIPTTPVSTPTTHQVASGSVPLFSSSAVVRFVVPETASVTVHLYTTDGDTFSSALYDAEGWASVNAGVVAPAYWRRGSGMSSMNTIDLAAGTYYVSLACTNLIQRCAVSYAVTALY